MHSSESFEHFKAAYQKNTVTLTDIEKIKATVNQAQQELIELLQDLIRIPTINTGQMPTGNELEACLFLAPLLRAEKIPCEIYRSAASRANLVATLKGKRGSPTMIWLSHLDVVPPGDDSLWRFPPFSAEISDKAIYGRGATDCKGLAASQLMALILLKRMGIELDGDLTVIASADEEAGGEYGLGWLAGHEPDLLHADLALNEGGGQPFSVNGNLAYLLGIGEKGRFEAQIKVKGKGAHAALPWRSRNPYFTMAELLKRLEQYRPEKHPYHPAFDRLRELLEVRSSSQLPDLDRFIKHLSRESPGIENILLGMTRLTITPTGLDSGVKSNVIPESGFMVCDIRTLPHQDLHYLDAVLSKIVSGLQGVEYNLKCTAKSSSSAIEIEILHLIEESLRPLVRGEYKKICCLPSLTVGFTDSRYLRPFGTIVYNFSPSHPDQNPTHQGAHNIDECMEIDELIFKTRFFITFALHYLKSSFPSRLLS